MPDETTGFAYVNAKDALPLLARSRASKLPADLPDLRTLHRLRRVEAQRAQTFTAFLQVGNS